MGHGYKYGTASEWFNTLPLGCMYHENSTNSENVLSPRETVRTEAVNVSFYP